MKNVYEINTEISDNTALNISSFVDDSVSTEDALNVVMTLMQKGFKVANDGRHLVKGWGSISNNEIISVSYVMMGSNPLDEEVLCVRYNYHREEWPGYEMIDHTEDYSGGATWEGFKRKFKLA